MNEVGTSMGTKFRTPLLFLVSLPIVEHYKQQGNTLSIKG